MRPRGRRETVTARLLELKNCMIWPAWTPNSVRSAKEATPSPVRVHRLPIRLFDHAGAERGRGGQNCHGAIETMQRVRRCRPLMDGNCHRDANAQGGTVASSRL
jgi:hypothetical protein